MTNTLPQNMRNISFIAQGGAGKSALIETMLFMAHETERCGSRDKGNAALTTEPEEQQHGIDITSHVGHLTWNGVDIHIMDTPGYFSFLESTRGVLPGCDGALLIISAVDGVKPETKRLWKMLQEFEIPTIGFITQVDDPEAKYEETLLEISSTLNSTSTPVTLPIGSGEAFTGVVELFHGKGRTYSKGKVSEIDVPDSLTDQIATYKTSLVEQIAEADDELIEKYLEGGELTSDELRKGLKNAVLNRNFLPLFCGSGVNGIGVELLIESVIEYLPSPVERDTLKPFIGHDPSDENRLITRRCSDAEPFSAITLKTTIDRFSGKLSVVRVVSGKAGHNEAIYNATQGSKEKIGNVYILQGNDFVQVDSLSAGDIGAFAKLEDTHTGDTLCSDKDQIKYPCVSYTQPLVFHAVEADGDEEKVSTGLHKLVEEDPTLLYYREPETGESILAGMSQTHIDIALERLNRKFSGTVKLKAPRVPYRETIQKKVQVQGKLKKQTGGHGQFANCWITLEPLERGEGFLFVDQITGGIIPKQYIPSIEKGIREAMQKGPLGGYPVVDCKAVVVDGSFHKVDSSDYAFQTAGSMAFQAAVEEAGPVLLEPIMELQILVGDEAIGEVVKDISSRRGRILNMAPKDDRQEIHAEAPYAELLDYGAVLSSLTAGRGLYVMHQSHYNELPSHLVASVIKGKEEE
ncbi:MAG: elongation factor G [Bdellovibrionales bacterium]|nr:elongation factor G [Bdellovibrionales bacterium]